MVRLKKFKYCGLAFLGLILLGMLIGQPTYHPLRMLYQPIIPNPV
jgi:hypothetical protein